MPVQEIIIKDTHRGLYYEDGVLLQILGAGRYELPLPKPGQGLSSLFRRQRKSEVILVDMRAAT